MSKLVSLRVLVNERLTAAAEEIFALFERTIAEYEEENQRRQRLLEQEKPTLLESTAGTKLHIHSPNLEITETVSIKEEPEEQSSPQQGQVSGCPLSSCAAFVKTEESSQFQTQDGDLSFETPFFHQTQDHLGLCPDIDDYWKRPLGCLAAQMETEDNKDIYKPVHITERGTIEQNSSQSPKYNSVPKTRVSVNDEDTSGTDEEAEKKKRQCHLCHKTFQCNRSLQIHIRVHTGERPYSCPICHKQLTQKGKLQIHMRTHTNEKPYSCSICNKAFTRKDILDTHIRIHTGEKPYSCPLCSKEFNQSSNLKKHIKTHSKPHTSQYSSEGL